MNYLISSNWLDPHNTSVSNTGVNTHNLSSPIITRRSTEIRQRLEPMERR